METFSFTTSRDDVLFFEVNFSGELIGGSEITSEKFQKLIKQLRLEAESRVVFIDLNNVQFWDTAGMRQILGLTHEINSKLNTHRVYIIGPKDGYLFKRAKEKYKDKVDITIPWQKDRSSIA